MVVVIPVFYNQQSMHYAAGIFFFQCSGEFVASVCPELAIAGSSRDTNQHFTKLEELTVLLEKSISTASDHPQRKFAEQCTIARTLAISSIYGGIYLVRLLKVSISGSCGSTFAVFIAVALWRCLSDG